MSECRKYFRQSETTEQQEYEQHILAGHYPEVAHDSQGSASEGKDGSHSSMKDRMKVLWNKSVKESFPEAVADFAVVKNAMKVDSSFKKDMCDSNRFPEILKVGQVRRGLDLAPKEQKFVALRKLHVRNAFARYLAIDPASVHPEDIPTVGWG